MSAVLAEQAHIGDGCRIGIGEEAPNVFKPNIYAFGLATIGEDTVIPDGITVGKNTVISGRTVPEDYENGTLPGGGALIREDGDIL